ncbi:hypothetical protein [Mucilaginibacter sp.]|jgi:hypothetical protein|uniref:hypothetical protein n=1 Tax=Mucilaginibacter sp. TaxID=1882438 RepID=UPI002C0A97AA|nr:hypothetical protein [Mucilaginibacter sp.]HTI58947.1 hypothetical protein [Mucilaginibacter sp.]
MNRLLTRLGVSPEIQAFFKVSAKLYFSYGDQQEHYGEGLHTVPSTQNLWVAGSHHATHVIVTYSVIEAMAFITLNRHRFPRLEQLAFIAIGNRWYPEQGNWIRQNFKGRKFTLVFGKDLIGHITDIKVAAGIKNIAISVFHSENGIVICRGSQSHIFKQEQATLHAFQEAFGIRPRFRTGKPVQSLTFLEQLKYDAER